MDRPISAVVITGAAPDTESIIRNNLRVAPGDPYDDSIVQQDVDILYRLGRFRSVSAQAELAPDGTVRVRYDVSEQPPIVEIQVTGNKVISDQDILSVVRQSRGGPRDDFLIERAVRDIRELYVEKGYYLTDVTFDRRAIEERDTLIFTIEEGPRVRVRAIRFEGNEAFRDKLLISEVRSRTHILLLRKGVLDEQTLDEDVASLVAFYTERGYLNVRVDRTIQLSPDDREATIVFLLEEGERSTVGRIRTENALDTAAGISVFSDRQIAARIPIKTGDTYAADKVRESVEIIRESYEQLGYIDVRVTPKALRTGDGAVVDLLFSIEEGEAWTVGTIEIKDNFLTQDRVIRREMTIQPGRPFDRTELRESERRLERLRLFSNVRVTIMEPQEDLPNVRDVLVEVAERNTGSFNFGAAVGSDSGLIGEISLTQENFDLYDIPETFAEFVTGRAFRGAGQRFNMSLRPGTELFEYSIGLTEPSFLDTEYSLSLGAFYRERRLRNNDEERLSGSLGLGRRFGDVWQGGLRVRGESVELTDISTSAPTELLLDQGPDTLTSLGLSLTRTTVGTITRPGSGSRLELSLDRVGALGGDYDFWRSEVDFTTFITLAEDFLGRRSILKLNTRAGYIFDEDPRVPTYERFYLGGRSFRGFDFRTVSPKGVRIDNGGPADEIGGTWLFFAGAQYEVPLFQENITGVVFVDSGTVTNEVGFDDYRVSVGLGLRLYIPQLGPVPIAFDFGFPIRDFEGDESQVFSFSAELPF